MITTNGKTPLKIRNQRHLNAEVYIAAWVQRTCTMAQIPDNSI